MPRLPLLTLLLVGLSVPALAQQPYRFTRVSLSAAGPLHFGAVINNPGDIAYLAGDQRRFVLVRDGMSTPLSPVAALNGYVAMNDAGVVALSSSSTTLWDPAIWTGEAGGLVALFQPDAVYHNAALGGINAAGDVVFTAWIRGSSPSVQVLFKGRPGAVEELITTGQPIPLSSREWSESRVFEGLEPPAINDSGVVVVLGGGRTWPWGEWFGGLYSVADGAVTPIVESRTAGFGRFALAEDGAVAYTVHREDGEVDLVRRHEDHTRVAASSDGPYSGFWAVDTNRAGTVVFLAGLDSGGHGLFAGADPAAGRIIGVGDALDGSTVTAVGVPSSGWGFLNEAGQVVFNVQLADGRAGIFRADPADPPRVMEALRLPQTAISGCVKTTGSITLAAPAPAGGLVVSLNSDNLHAVVPDRISFTAGVVKKSFPIVTSAVATRETVTIEASALGQAISETFTLKPMLPKSVTLSPISVVGGGSVTGTVTLQCPAGPGDIVVTLSSSNPSVATPAAASLLIPAGVKAMPFDVTTMPVAEVRTVSIKAAANGITRVRTLTVNPAP